MKFKRETNKRRIQRKKSTNNIVDYFEESALFHQFTNTVPPVDEVGSWGSLQGDWLAEMEEGLSLRPGYLPLYSFILSSLCVATHFF